MKINSELTKALNGARDILATRQRIQSEIENAISIQPAAEARLQDKMEALGDAEADSALLGETAGSSSAQTALAAARDSVDAISARILGLQRKLNGQEDAIIASHATVARLRDEFCTAAIAEYRANFLKAAEPLMEVIRAGFGLSAGLGIALNGLGPTQVHDPVSGVCLFPFEKMDGGASNRTFQTSHDQVAAVRDEAIALEKIADSISKGRQEREALKVVLSRNSQPGISGTYTGLSEAEWREAQSRVPRGPFVIRTAA